MNRHKDDLDEVDQTSPIQLAVQAEHLSTVQELIISGANLTMADHEGNNVYHYASKVQDNTIIQVGHLQCDLIGKN